MANLKPSSWCKRCGRRLTQPISISRGMGGTCWARSAGITRFNPRAPVVVYDSHASSRPSRPFRTKHSLLEAFGPSLSDVLKDPSLSDYPEFSEVVKTSPKTLKIPKKVVDED